MRGSFTPSVRKLATSSRIASATRSARRLFVAMVTSTRAPPHPGSGRTRATLARIAHPPEAPSRVRLKERPHTIDDPAPGRRCHDSVERFEHRLGVPPVAGHEARGELRALPGVLAPGFG